MMLEIFLLLAVLTGGSSRVLNGAETTALLAVGTRVVRGPDWIWGNEDGDPPGVGTVVELNPSNFSVDVIWDNQIGGFYRMDTNQGIYDLQLAECGDNLCDENADCEVVEAGIDCTCKIGYQGNGLTCEANVCEVKPRKRVGCGKVSHCADKAKCCEDKNCCFNNTKKGTKWCFRPGNYIKGDE